MTDEGRCLPENPSEMLMEAVVLMLSLYRTVKECRVAAISSEFCIVVSMVGQLYLWLLYLWLGSCIYGCCIYGWAVVVWVRLLAMCLHVTVRGLAAVGSPQPIAQGM